LRVRGGAGAGAHNGQMDLLSAIRERDRSALDALVADDVVFYSPATIYRGREQVVELLALIGSVLKDVTVTREVETVKFIKGRSEDDELDGVLVEIKGDDGRITEITLLLRPLAALQRAVMRLARALAEGPQPDV
jgi:ketosteroid isomerase-like protein